MNISIDGGILAGGLSTRMNGNDKGLSKFNNQTMARHVHKALSPNLDKVFINCNKNHQGYSEITPHICSDSSPDFLGPLAGISSLLNTSNADFMIICPCDTPLIDTTFVDKMVNALKIILSRNPSPKQKILLAAKENENFHPLHLCISTNFKHNLEKAVSTGSRRVMRWVEDNDVDWIDFSSEESLFLNINTQDELSKISKIESEYYKKP